MTGWECPRCGRCYSPDVAQCMACPARPVAGNTASVCIHPTTTDGVCVSCGCRFVTYQIASKPASYSPDFRWMVNPRVGVDTDHGWIETVIAKGPQS